MFLLLATLSAGMAQDVKLSDAQAEIERNKDALKQAGVELGQ